MKPERIGEILIQQGALTEEQLRSALSLQQHQRPRRKLGEILLERRFIGEKQLTKALATQCRIPYYEKIQPEQLSGELLRKFPLEFLQSRNILPVKTSSEPGVSRQSIVIAMADVTDGASYDMVLNILGSHYLRIACPTAEITQAISSCYYKNIAAGSTQGATGTANVTDSGRSEDLLNIANQPPVIKMVNMLFFRAVQNRASDIHIEPYDDELKVRLRVDGVLHEILTLPSHQGPGLVSRLKIMAGLNIAERRLPQDGQSNIRLGQKELDIRVSTIPISAGERIVLRLLDKTEHKLSLDQLGFDRELGNRFGRLIHAPHGITLLTGPTGSGKTTTLYAALNTLNSREHNILTVEDPIEYRIAGIGQMQVKPKINLTFANCLRHILRQDPDIIMIGEIRDRETAEIAIQASLTGHMVLSTLHTNDSAGAITRLTDMGIDSYLISSSLTAVMAQRLVRKICPQCKRPAVAEDDISSLWENSSCIPSGPVELWSGSGCENCLQTGYLGRCGIFELLIVTGEIKHMITSSQPGHIIKSAAVADGLISLRDSGLSKAIDGQTTIAEVLRVTQDSVISNVQEPDHASV